MKYSFRSLSHYLNNYTVPVSVVLGSDGKPSFIRVLVSSRGEPRFMGLAVKACVIDTNITHYAAQSWMPVIDLTGRIIRSGIVIVDYYVKFETDIFSAEEYSLVHSEQDVPVSYFSSLYVDCFSEELGLFTLNMNMLCKMVADDVKSGITRFVNLDYENFVSMIQRRKFRDCLHLFDNEGFIWDTESYEQDPMTLLSYMPTPFAAYHVKGLRCFISMPDNDVIKIEPKDHFEGDIWIPSAAEAPLFQRTNASVNLHNVFFPKQVADWGIIWRGGGIDTPHIEFPESVLGSTYITLSTFPLNRVLIPFNSIQDNRIYFENGLFSLISIRDTSKRYWKRGLGNTAINLSEQCNCETLIIDVNMAAFFSIVIDCHVKTLYLIDRNPKGHNPRAMKYEGFVSNLSDCIIYASPRIYADIYSRYAACEGRLHIYHGDGSELLK